MEVYEVMKKNQYGQYLKEVLLPVALAYHRTYGLSVTISRCSNNYGPYHFPEKLIPLMIASALADKPLPVYGEGLNVRDWLYVEDQCKAIDLIIHKSRMGEVYNAGGHNKKQSIEIVKIICKELGKPESNREWWYFWRISELLRENVQQSLKVWGGTGMKFFVTGVGGQLGHGVMNELLKRGHEGVGSDIQGNYSGVVDGSEVTKAPYVALDITNKEAVEKVITEVNPDAVIHCAAWIAVDMVEDDDKVAKVRAINAGGTQNIADVCKNLDCNSRLDKSKLVEAGFTPLPQRAYCVACTSRSSIRSASAEGYTLEDGTALNLSGKNQKWLGLKDTFKF